MKAAPSLTPRRLGFRMPAEWEPHQATWLSWPHEATTWPEKVPFAEQTMARWVRELARTHERVDVNVLDAAHESRVRGILEDWDVLMAHVHLHPIPTADVWIRDYGPIFITRKDAPDDGYGRLAVTAWDFDAWGGKGAGYYGDREHRDRSVAESIGTLLDVPVFKPGMVLEGGGIEVNGGGTLMAARDCLLTHRQREGGSPAGVQANVEHRLHDYLGVDHFIWVENVHFEGDDTDGHIDNLARFVGPRTIAVAMAEERSHPLYRKLRDTVRFLERQRTETGHPVEVVPLPMPTEFHYRWLQQGSKVRQQFPASYLNFYIGNHAVLVPIYADRHDVAALDLLSRCFPDRHVIPIDCCDYILGQGAIHCSTQQVPRV